MPGRHATPSRTRSRRRQGRRARGPLVVGGAVLVLLVGATVVWATGRGEEAAACTREQVSVAAAPDVAEAVGAAVRATDSSSACRGYDITSTPSVEVVETLAGDGDAAPDLWIPDAGTWPARADSRGAAAPEVVTGSIATSPVVLVGTKDTVGRPESWGGVLQEGRLRIGNALASAPAAAVLAAARTEPGVDEAALTAALVPLAQAETESRATGVGNDLVAAAASGDARTVVSEQQWLRSRQTLPGLSAAAPSGSTPFLDHPVAATAPGSGRAAAVAAGRELARRLASRAGRRALADAGFRTDAGEPPEGGLDGLDRAQAPGRRVLRDMLRSWSLLALPPRALAVVDVSGSMRERSGDSTRVDLAIEAAARGRQLFRDNAALGLWAFSTGLDGRRDFLPLVPVRRMDADVGGRSQREVLETETASLRDRTGGGTGLYDTVLAAYRTQQASYDPRAENSVILLTDGENEDPGSLSLRELLDALEREADPARPVVVIAIGITEDADAAALSRIARATGGTSYVARSADDIPGVFVRSLLARVAA